MTYALFSSSEAARRAVDALRALRVKDEALSVVDGGKLDHFHEGDREEGGSTSGLATSGLATSGLDRAASSHAGPSTTIDPMRDGRGAAPSTDPLHAAPVTGNLEGGRAPDSDQRKEANTAQAVAGGMGLAAIGSMFVLPGLGIVLGGGALAATLLGVLTKNSGAQESSRDLTNYLRAQDLSDDTVALIQSQLESGGSLVQIDTVASELPEVQILQVVSDHGGRIAWDLGSGLSHAPTARHA